MTRPLRLVAAVAFGTASLLAPATVTAHAEYTSSTPADKAVVPAPFGGPVIIVFSEDLAAGSKVEILGPTGASLGTSTTIAPGHPSWLEFAFADAPGPGAYTARWTSVADDGDLLRGEFTFTIVAAPPTATPLPPTAVPTATSAPTIAPSPSPASPTPAPTPTPSAGGSGSGTGSDVVIPIAAAVVILGGFGLFLLRRGRGA